MAARDTALAGGEPDPKKKKLILGFIALFLGLQALIPLRYYLGDDPYDERFSWRMFSAVRVHRCQLGITETDSAGGVRPIDLIQEVHRAWVTTLQRNRRAVVEKFLASRCAGEGVASSRLVNQCMTPNGTRLEPIVWQIDCASREITASEIMLERDEP